MTASVSNIKKWSIAVLVLLPSLFLFFLLWLPASEALRATGSIPFLFIFPGYALTKVFFRSLDYVEKATLSLLLSFVIIHFGVFFVEELSTRMTGWHILWIALSVNLLSSAAFLMRSLSLRSRLFSRLRGSFQKNNEH